VLGLADGLGLAIGLASVLGLAVVLCTWPFFAVVFFAGFVGVSASTAMGSARHASSSSSFFMYVSPPQGLMSD